LVCSASGLLLGAGRAIASGVGWADEAEPVWSIARWRIGLIVAAFAVFILSRIAPCRQNGPPLAILAGSLVAVVMWAAFTGLLSLYLPIQTGSAYGSLLSIVALLILSMLTLVARPSPRFGYGVSARRAATS
jgi:uncharacterized BrkB/YihY/UPF0761 family membrane protein